MGIDSTIGGIILILLGGIGYMIKRAIGKNDKDNERSEKLQQRVAKLEIKHEDVRAQLQRIEHSIDKILDILLKDKGD